MGIFGSSNQTCPSHPTGPQYGADHLAGSLTFHKLSVILAAAFTIAACLISGFAHVRQALHFSNPHEQTKILRIIALVPVFAIISFLSVAFPEAATYLEPWTDVYESVALASFFLLLVVYLVPVSEKQDTFFDRLPLKDRRGKETANGSLKWFRKTWISVFQYPIVAFLVALATDITQSAGLFCVASSKPHFAHIWLQAIRSISVAIAFLAIVGLYTRLRPDLAAHQPFAKLLGIKGIVFLSFVQNIVFTILHSTNALKPTSSLSYDDITFGLPNLLLCVEMLIFSLLHLYASNSTPYHNSIRGGYVGGRCGIKAIAATCNPLEIIQGIGQGAGYQGRTECALSGSWY
ncbi:N amino acid transport system protein [Physcia stellaris]|nr:N amino acid transport system protein [Physcia stellaris]